MLGYILDATVCALVLDGLRRWWQRRAGGMPPEGWDGLMQAALAGDTKRCEALLDNATPIIGSDLWGCTVLHAASKGGSIPIVKKLLDHGALVDEPDSWDETPLHIAARAGHADVCELLLAHGAEDSPDEDANTCIRVQVDSDGQCHRRQLQAETAPCDVYTHRQHADPEADEDRVPREFFLDQQALHEGRKHLRAQLISTVESTIAAYAIGRIPEEAEGDEPPNTASPVNSDSINDIVNAQLLHQC